MIKKQLIHSLAGFSLLLGIGSQALAETCPGNSDDSFTYSGILPTGWTSNAQDQMTKGDHKFLQVTWKADSDSAKGTIYCTYAGSVVLSSTNTAIPKPTGSNWEASSLANTYHCPSLKSKKTGIKDCEFETK